MKKLLDKYIWMRAILGILLVATGITTIILAIIDRGSVSKTLNLIFACLTILFGGLSILLSLCSETRKVFTTTLFFGAVLLAIGITSLIVPNFISVIFVNLLAVLLITLGGTCFAKGIFGAIYRMKGFYIFLLFVCAAIGVALGIMALLNKEYAFVSTFIAVGVIITSFGIGELVIALTKQKERKKK